MDLNNGRVCKENSARASWHEALAPHRPVDADSAVGTDSAVLYDGSWIDHAGFQPSCSAEVCVCDHGLAGCLLVLICSRAGGLISLPWRSVPALSCAVQDDRPAIPGAAGVESWSRFDFALSVPQSILSCPPVADCLCSQLRSKSKQA